MARIDQAQCAEIQILAPRDHPAVGTKGDLERTSQVDPVGLARGLQVDVFGLWLGVCERGAKLGVQGRPGSVGAARAAVPSWVWRPVWARRPDGAGGLDLRFWLDPGDQRRHQDLRPATAQVLFGGLTQQILDSGIQHRLDVAHAVRAVAGCETDNSRDHEQCAAGSTRDREPGRRGGRHMGGVGRVAGGSTLGILRWDARRAASLPDYSRAASTCARSGRTPDLRRL